MPRKAKTTLSGQPAQPIGAVAGQMYGAGVEQMALQRQMPAPQVSGPVAPPAGAAPPVPVEPLQPSPADKHQRAKDETDDQKKHRRLASAVLRSLVVSLAALRWRICQHRPG